MKRKITHYHLLGLEPGVSTAEIKRAYRNLVKQTHPDVGSNDNNEATEKMMRLNEAYETLMDRGKRAHYDVSIGLTVRGGNGKFATAVFVTEDADRDRYLRLIFHPARRSICRLLNMYQKELRKLSLDIYDDELVLNFENYADHIESTLRTSSNALSSETCPRTLHGAQQMMRYAIAQAADGLEEMRRFSQNFDYNHLAMAGNLFRIASDLLKQALALTRN